MIETLLWEDGEFFLLEEHLSRLRESARRFSFPYGEDFIYGALQSSSADFSLMRKYRTRLLLGPEGEVKINSRVLSEIPETPVRLALSGEKTDRNDDFLRHKTTRRDLYDRKLRKCREKGFFDVIFTNREDEVTEGAVTNIMIRKGDLYLSPPLSCGVLPGTFRQHLLREKDRPVKEKVLHVEDLIKADEIYAMNSVRKILPASFHPDAVL